MSKKVISDGIYLRVGEIGKFIGYSHYNSKHSIKIDMFASKVHDLLDEMLSFKNLIECKKYQNKDELLDDKLTLIECNKRYVDYVRTLASNEVLARQIGKGVAFYTHEYVDNLVSTIKG